MMNDWFFAAMLLRASLPWLVAAVVLSLVATVAAGWWGLLGVVLLAAAALAFQAWRYR